MRKPEADFDPSEPARLRQLVERYGSDRLRLTLSDQESDGALGFTRSDPTTVVVQLSSDQADIPFLQDVRLHGRITRREAAELCSVGSQQAKRLLTRLEEGGLLVPTGTLRGNGAHGW